MKQLKLLSIIILVTFGQTLFAHDLQLKIFQDIKNFYSKNKIDIKIEINEKSDSISAIANTDGIKKIVTVDRGLLNSKRLSSDGLRIVICHEIGHLLGGAPRKSPPMDWDGPVAPDGNSWMASEGQSDYYATAICFREVITGQEHDLFLKNQKISERLGNLCAKAWVANSNNFKICLRAGLAGENFLKLTFDFPISFETPSAEVVTTTIRDSYPSRQCRLDTILAGALCNERLPLILDLNDSKKNLCSTSIGRQPICWFAEK